MDKAELVGITLDRLLAHYALSPESFEFIDNGSPTIVWRPKIQQDDLTGTPVKDPNNDHAVVVRWNSMYKSVNCYVFVTAPLEPQNCTDKADSTMSSQRYFEQYRGNYRKLMKLKKLVLERNSQKANLVYLRKLSSVFPDAIDTRLL
jgi:hypothetical protein